MNTDIFKTKKFFALNGNNYFLKEIYKNKIISSNPECDLINLDLNDLKENDLFDKVNYRDLFSTSKIFFIRNSDKIKNIEKLNSGNNILIFDFKKKIKNINKNFVNLECNVPPPWEQEKDAISKIISFFNKKNINISIENAKHIYFNIGYDLFKIIMECKKIILFKNDLSDVSKEEINRICFKKNEDDIFILVDKIIDNNKKEALHHLDNLFRGNKNPSILLITLLYTKFENMLYIKTTKKIDEEYLKLPSSVLEKLRNQALKISEDRIIYSLNFLCNLDFSIRNGSFNPKFYLEKFIINF
jgi:DNA polymerase III delta subunit